MRDTVINVSGSRPDPAELNQHGIDLTRFEPDAAHATACASELGLEGKLIFARFPSDLRPALPQIADDAVPRDRGS
jgi:hypothetical protein